MPPVSITFSGDTIEAALAAAASALNVTLLAPAAATAEVPAEAAPARTRGRPRKEAAETAPAPAAAPAPAPAAAGGVEKKDAIQKLVTLINANDALGRNGKQVCTDLCNKFGGKNISQIDPSKYGAVVAAVDEALEALNSDPTA
jgi:hypothetical protein